MEISEYIKATRKKLGLTQEELAALLHTKRYNIAKYETKKAMPPGSFILDLQGLLPVRPVRRRQ